MKIIDIRTRCVGIPTNSKLRHVESGYQLNLKNKVSKGLYVLEINGKSISRAVKLVVE